MKSFKINMSLFPCLLDFDKVKTVIFYGNSQDAIDAAKVTSQKTERQAQQMQIKTIEYNKQNLRAMIAECNWNQRVALYLIGCGPSGKILREAAAKFLWVFVIDTSPKTIRSLKQIKNCRNIFDLVSTSTSSNLLRLTKAFFGCDL
jgi:hypothetical protein